MEYETNIKIKLLPFNAPRSIALKSPISAVSDFLPLDMVDTDTLMNLCNQYTVDVFKYAKKQMPPTQECWTPNRIVEEVVDVVKGFNMSESTITLLRKELLLKFG